MFRDSVETAKSLFKETTDKAHDVNHVRRVAENCRLIGNLENYPNTELLELCGWWHDVKRSQGTGHEEASAIAARDDLISRGVDQKTANIVYDAIKLHKISMKPETYEGNIVRDADKLDFISIERWEACLKANQLKHLYDIKAYLPVLRDKVLKLESSKQIYDQRITKFIKSGVVLQLK